MFCLSRNTNSYKYPTRISGVSDVFDVFDGHTACRGKISSHEFDVATGLCSNDDLDELQHDDLDELEHQKHRGMDDDESDDAMETRTKPVGDAPGTRNRLNVAKGGRKENPKPSNGKSPVHVKGGVLGVAGNKLQSFLDLKKKRLKRKKKGLSTSVNKS